MNSSDTLKTKAEAPGGMDARQGVDSAYEPLC